MKKGDIRIGILECCTGILGAILMLAVLYFTTVNDSILRQFTQEPVIIWKDEALGKAIKDNMRRSEDREVTVSRAETFDSGIYYDSVGGFTTILEGKDIKCLDDLQYFTSLSSLIIRNTGVTDFSPLEKMDNLRMLSIEGSEGADLAAIGRLEKLIRLELRDMPDATIPSLENLEELMVLDLNGISLENLSEIGRLKELSNLYIENTNTKDVSILSDFPCLTYLTLDHCPVEALPRLPRGLDILRLRRTVIEDLSGLPREIESIVIENNAPVDVITLNKNGRSNINTLEIYNTELSHTRGRLSVHNLSSLSLENCKLEKFDFIEARNLKSLNLAGNEIKSIKDIKNAEGVRFLDLSHNELVDLDGIEKFTQLKSLDLTGNKITNADILKELANLEEVDLTGNPVSTEDTEMELQDVKAEEDYLIRSVD